MLFFYNVNIDDEIVGNETPLDLMYPIDRVRNGVLGEVMRSPRGDWLILDNDSIKEFGRFGINIDESVQYFISMNEVQAHPFLQLFTVRDLKLKMVEDYAGRVLTNYHFIGSSRFWDFNDRKFIEIQPLKEFYDYEDKIYFSANEHRELYITNDEFGDRVPFAEDSQKSVEKYETNILRTKKGSYVIAMSISILKQYLALSESSSIYPTNKKSDISLIDTVTGRKMGKFVSLKATNGDKAGLVFGVLLTPAFVKKWKLKEKCSIDGIAVAGKGRCGYSSYPAWMIGNWEKGPNGWEMHSTVTYNKELLKDPDEFEFGKKAPDCFVYFECSDGKERSISLIAEEKKKDGRKSD